MFAQEEARSLHSPVIDGVHLLLGIARCEGAAAAVLGRIGVTANALRARYASLNTPTDDTYSGHIPFTPTAKHALESALREALTLGHAHIGAEHILLGLAREADSNVGALLADLGTDVSALRQAVIEHLSGQHTQARESRETHGSREERQGRNDPVLEQFGTNLTALAAQGKLDAMIGRERELERVIQILSRRTKNNPCLVGEPGVGKTAIVEGLAVAIHGGRVPDTIAGCEVWTLDIGSLVAGARYRGDFEERMKKVVKEVSSRDDIILFLDELHTVIGAGSSEGALDAANLLKPALARGEVRVVGATTYDEYRKHVEKDPALERRFQQVKVEEPSRELTVEILTGVRDSFAEHHGVEITQDAISTAVELAARYVTDRFFPDKAVDLIDEAGAYLRIHPELPRVLNADVVSVVCEHATGIPIRRNEAESARLLSMETDLQARVVGQPFALSALAKSIRRSRAGLRDLRRPVGSFLFLGPTGVGKTETAKALAELLFGDDTAMISIDMSEYQEKHTVSRLIGAPPGYVGHDEPGQLTEAVRRKPYSVVLLDEVEKAHPDVFNVLLQLLEEGRLTDATGRQVDFSNCVVIATSNLGSSEFQRASVGFSVSAKDTSHRELQRTAEEAARKFFRPELLNRIDEVIVFNQLSQADVESIAALFVDQLAGRLAERSVSLTVSESARAMLARVGFDQTLGARPLRRAVQRLVEDPLAEKMLRGHLQPGSHVLVEELDGELVFVVEQSEAALLAAVPQSC